MISVLPNTITLGRLLSVPFLAIILSGHDYQLAFWFFLVLGFFRRFGWVCCSSIQRSHNGGDNTGSCR